MPHHNVWLRQEITGAMGVTTVPLPAFWFSSKNEGDQLRGSPHKEHLCQNPRCAANNMAYNTSHPEPPVKRIKGSFKNFRRNNVCQDFSNRTPTDSEACGGTKARGRNAGKYADFAAPTDSCGSVRTHRRRAGTYADCSVDSYPQPMDKPRRESCLVQSIKGSIRTKAEELTGINPNESKRSTGTNSKESTPSAGINAKESTRSTGIPLKESTRSKGFTRSIGIDSIESTTSISSGSHAPSISTPRRSPPKPSKIVLGPLSAPKESTSTGSSSPGCSQGTTQSLPASRLSDSIDRSMAKHNTNLILSFLRSGRMAPPNSERGEEELPSIKELDWLEPSLTLPQFHGSPVGSSSTSHSPPLATSMDPNTRPPKQAPTSSVCLPVRSLSISSCPPTLPTDVDPVSRAVSMASKNDSQPSNLTAAPLSSDAATTPPEATTTGIRATPTRSSSPAIKLSEGHSGSSFSHGPSIIECTRTQALQKSRERDLPSRSSTMATMSNAAQMCILEQRLEDEDHRSNSSSLNTVSSDSSTESYSIGLSGPFRGTKPVSAFYNALYAPDSTFPGTTALEAHLHWLNRRADRKLRVAIEIVMLSAMVAILVVVLYPAVTRGLRSHFYGCCSCPAGPITAASRKPSQHYLPLKTADGCVYTGRSSWNCLPEQQMRGSTVVK